MKIITIQIVSPTVEVEKKILLKFLTFSLFGHGHIGPVLGPKPFTQEPRMLIKILVKAL